MIIIDTRFLISGQVKQALYCPHYFFHFLPRTLDLLNASGHKIVKRQLAAQVVRPRATRAASCWETVGGGLAVGRDSGCHPLLQPTLRHSSAPAYQGITSYLRCATVQVIVGDDTRLRQTKLLLAVRPVPGRRDADADDDTSVRQHS